MDKINGGSAFPTFTAQYDYGIGEKKLVTVDPGMALRDYFAAKAMQGFCANPAATPQTQEHFDNLAIDALRMADAMLKARET